MSEMPSLGESPKQSPLVPVAITAVVVGLLSGGIFYWKGRADAPVPEPVVAAPPQPAEAAPPQPVVEAPPTPSAAAEKLGLKSFQVSINGPLESAIVGSEGKPVGTALTQVVNRSLVWWLRVPQDLLKGDSLSVVYETRDNQEPLVHAVRFESRKLGRTFEAYRYNGRYYQADGSELEERLVDSPLDSYEQVTSLLRDGRKHKGVDFKTPSGTDVKATFDGVVTRKNWNFRGNGNSIELQESGGKHRTALFLHLSELPKSLSVGQRFKRGEVMARSGNTGHSFAPHLHYQLMQGSQVIDPFESHQTTRISLPAAEKPAFEKKAGELQALMPTAQVAGG